MDSQKQIIVYIYNSFNDPLFKGLLLTYFKQITKEDQSVSFHIITYEQKKYRLTIQERKALAKELKKDNIFWYPLKYHSGKFILFKKLWDFFLGFITILKLKIETQSDVLFTFTNIAGTVGFLISRIIGMKFIVFSYEPHSEFLADFELWSQKGWKFKILNKFERLMGKHGDYILTGTQCMVERLKEEGAKGKIYRVPSCVDENKFIYNASEGEIIRSKFKIGSRKCLIYLGKFGDLYYKEEIPCFFKTLLEHDKNFFFLIITPDDPDKTKDFFLDQDLDESTFAITYSHYGNIQNYISAGDMGLIAIRPAPSQKFRSPVKTGEYLLCGKPYIVCKGISEDDVYALQHNVGVVVKDFSPNEIKYALPKVNKLLAEKKSILNKRCRSVGIEYRGMEQVLEIIKEILEDAIKFK